MPSQSDSHIVEHCVRKPLERVAAGSMQLYFKRMIRIELAPRVEDCRYFYSLGCLEEVFSGTCRFRCALILGNWEACRASTEPGIEEGSRRTLKKSAYPYIYP
jgi:hypothetical protein